MASRRRRRKDKLRSFLLKVLLALLLVGSGLFMAWFINREKVGDNIINVSESTQTNDIDSLIKSLGAENILLFQNGTYGESERQLITMEGFDESKLSEYAKYRRIDAQYRISLVNAGVLNEDNYEILQEVVKDPYFMEERVERYASYSGEYSSVRELVELVNANRDLTAYETTFEADLSLGYAVNVNKYYYLPYDYEPDDLVLIDYSIANIGFDLYLREEAYNALVRMDADAYEQGVELYVTSAYRSATRQDELWNGYADSDGAEVADTYSARPGFSDHQTGLTVDFHKDGYALEDYENFAEANWLAENAYKYGFIIRYPEGKENVTGYVYESWHYRYVGEELAAKVYESGLTYDEYYTYYIEGGR